MSKRRLIGVLGATGIALLFILLLRSDWLVVGVYFLLSRHSLLDLLFLLFLLLVFFLLPAFAILYVANATFVQPESWTKRRLAGFLLLILAFLLLISLHPLSLLVIGYLGMPRRIVPVSPFTYFEWAATVIALPLMAASGAWLMRTKPR